MADLDDIKDGKDFGIGTPQQNVPFTLKGCGSLDWGCSQAFAHLQPAKQPHGDAGL
jgi:putative autoinducer-2 (AI-2) aldolase